MPRALVSRKALDSRAGLGLTVTVALLSALVLVPAQGVGAATPTSPGLVSEFGSGGSGAGQFSQPHDVAVGTDGTVYVTDSFGARVEVFDRMGGFLDQFGSYGTGPGQFHHPTGLAVDDRGWVFVVDNYLNRVQVFDDDFTYRYGWGSTGSGPGQFSFPDGIALGSDDTVYVVDSVNHRVQQFSLTGTYLRSWGSQGSAAGQFNVPRRVTVDVDGRVMVTDQNNSRVQVFSSTGVFQRTFGTPGSGAGQFQFPVGIAVDANRHVYVVDRYADNVERWVQPATGSASYLATFGTSGSAPGQLDEPYGVAVSPDGLLYVTDSLNNRVQIRDLCAARFSDVARTNPFNHAICWMTATGVGTGYADGTYRPTQSVSRQAMAAHLYRLKGSPPGIYPDPGFTDVGGSSPFLTEISWLVWAGIGTGYPDGTFRPTLPVTRQAMAAFLYRLAGNPVGPFPDPGFSDVTPGHPFYTEIAWMASVGSITTGFPDGTFRPGSAVTRQAMAAFLARYDAALLH